MTRTSRVPQLILLNGPPGIGKSTIARRLAEDNAATECIDLDEIRSGLAGWRDDLDVSGRQARSIGLEQARHHLSAGRDVVVPQLLARPPFIEALEGLAAAVDAEFVELVLWDTKAAAIARFDERSGRRTAAGEPDEQGELLALGGSDAALADTYDRLEALLAGRPTATRVDAPTGDVDGTYARVLDHLPRH